MNHSDSLLSTLVRSILDYFHKAKAWAILEQGILFSRAFLWIVGIWLFDYLFESILNTYNKKLIIICLGLICAHKIISEVLSGSSNYLRSKNSYSNMGKFMVDFQQKLGKIEAINFEKAEFLDRVNRAKDCIEYEVLGYFTASCLEIITYYAPLLILTGYYLYQLFSPLVLIILCAFIPPLVGRIVQVKYFGDLEDETVGIRRQAEYYKSAIVDRVFFKETRLLGAFHYFFQLYKKAVQSVVDKHWVTERKVFLIQGGLSGITFLGLALAISLLILATLKQEISLANFTTVFFVLAQLFSLMDDLVVTCIGQLGESFIQVRNVYRIMDMEERRDEESSLSTLEGIKANHIFFRYPDSSEWIIDDLDLSLESGKTYALVGENGSGKSTLVKLLLGIYLPQAGMVRIFGLDSSRGENRLLYSKSSGVFQDFQRYCLTLKENVAISDLSYPIDDERVRKSLEKSQFKEKNIAPNQMLSPEFDGIDLSGGQWQRVAIARALYRPHNLIVLDEPTAAIDPIEESYLFNQFRQLTKNATALIVTHRLASSKNVDEIIVLEKGKIVEQGTYEELMKLEGIYYHMWQSQEFWYQTDR